MNASPKCPKCEFEATAPFDECPRCGVIVEKFLKIEKENKASENKTAVLKNANIHHLADATSLMIKQKKEWGEILTGFETKNKYEVVGQFNNTLMQGEEESGSAMAFLTRFFLKALRPFTMHLISPQGTGLYKLIRPFRFFFHELEVCESNGATIGTVKRRFSILRRIYTVMDRHGREVFELFGPLLHPWTFQIKQGDHELGKIVKKWSGLGKESFTDADNFGIIFPNDIDVSQKAVLLGAVFLIDFVHFENR